MKKQAYKGVVINKKSDEREGADDGSYTAYTLIIKTDDGQQKSVSVGGLLMISMTSFISPFVIR